MKKIIALTLMAALAVMTVGPAMTVAVDTSVTPNYSGGGGGTDIFVKGKWEMKGPCFDRTGDGTTGSPYVYTYNHCSSVPGEGKDDLTDPGAQFNAPGIWGDNMNYTVCAIVRGPNDHIDSIRDVYADIWYPTNRPMHTSGFSDCYTEYDPGGTSNDNTVEIDNPSSGCGVHIEQNNLHRLSQADGYNLVCNVLRVHNTDLPVWDPDYLAAGGPGGTEWEELCSTDIINPGELTKSWAAVYCSDKNITWEHPAGEYRVTATAYDTGDSQSNVLENYFTYREKQGFEIDFDKVDYGVLSINEHQMIAGDKCFWPGDSDIPTIRNTGNVRLNVKIAQDDMGLGRTELTYIEPDVYRANFDARVGDSYDDLTDYLPFGPKGNAPVYADCTSEGVCGDYTLLKGEILDLSEIEEMDFSILVKEKWPGNLASYSGSMWLSVNKADFDTCD